MGFKKLITLMCNDSEGEYAFPDDSVTSEGHAEGLKDKMRDIVRSLSSLIGTRNPVLISRLSHSIESMNETKMEELAENMAGVAVLHADLSAVKAGGTPASLTPQR